MVLNPPDDTSKPDSLGQKHTPPIAAADDPFRVTTRSRRCRRPRDPDVAEALVRHRAGGTAKANVGGVAPGCSGWARRPSELVVLGPS